MTNLVHPIGGFEIATLTWASRLNNLPVVLTFEGWEWFIVATAAWSIDNSGGAAAANAFLQAQYSNALVINAFSPFSVAAAASNAQFMGLQLPNTNIAGIISYAALPLVICPNATTISLGFAGGDANTKVGAGSMTIHGARRLNRAPKQ